MKIDSADTNPVQKLAVALNQQLYNQVDEGVLISALGGALLEADLEIVEKPSA